MLRVACISLLLLAAATPAAEPRLDRFGDPLPEGAVMRLGTTGLRLPGIAGVAFRPNGELVALTAERKLHVWSADFKSKSGVMSLPDDPPFVDNLTLAPDARFAAAYHAGRTRQYVVIWDLGGPRPVEHLTYGLPAVYRMTLSAGGKWLAVNSSWPRTEGVWLCDLMTKKWERLPLEKVGNVESMTFTPDAKRLTVATGFNVSVVETATRRVAFTWPTKVRPAFAALSPDGWTLAVQLSGAEPRLELIDVQSGNPVPGRRPEPGPARWVGFSPGSQNVLLGTSRAIRGFDRERGMVAYEIGGATQFPAVYSADRNRLAAVAGNAVVLWDVPNRRRFRPELLEAGHTGPVREISVSPDGKLIATGSAENEIVMWSANDGRTLYRLDCWRGCTAFLPDSKTLIAIAEDALTPVIHDANSGKEVRRFAVPAGWSKSDYVQEAQLSPDGKTLITTVLPFRNTKKSYTVRWDVETGRALDRTEHHDDPITRELRTIVSSPDGRWTASAGKITRADTQESFTVIMPGESRPGGRFSPDGRLVALPRMPRTREAFLTEHASVVIFDPVIGTTVAEVPAPSPSRWSFSNDSRQLAMASPGRVTLWDLAIGEPVWHSTDELMANIAGVALAPERHRLITGHDDGTSLVWDVPPPAHSRHASSAVWDALSGANPAKALAAEWQLADDPAKAITLLRERLRPVGPADEAALRPLIEKLSSGRFAERETATKSLRELGDRAVAPLRAALKAGLPAEAKRRVEALLAEADAPGIPAGERQRQVRAVAVLARINNVDSRKLLMELATGLPEARQTREAAEALKRMK
jgi:WD40 repeat protein